MVQACPSPPRKRKIASAFPGHPASARTRWRFRLPTAEPYLRCSSSFLVEEMLTDRLPTSRTFPVRREPVRATNRSGVTARSPLRGLRMRRYCLNHSRTAGLQTSGRSANGRCPTPGMTSSLAPKAAASCRPDPTPTAKSCSPQISSVGTRATSANRPRRTPISSHHRRRIPSVCSTDSRLSPSV
jgi:hypothetical protein